MQPQGYTLRDETLDHQVILYVESGKHDVHVSCNCSGTETGGHRSFGMSDSIQQSRDLYNEPENHTLMFHKADEAKW